MWRTARAWGGSYGSPWRIWRAGNARSRHVKWWTTSRAGQRRVSGVREAAHIRLHVIILMSGRWWFLSYSEFQNKMFVSHAMPSSPDKPSHHHVRVIILLYKAKLQYRLTLQVSRYCILALNSSCLLENALSIISSWLSTHHIINREPRTFKRTSQQIRDVHPRLFHCWANVADIGPTVNQPWVNVSCLLGLLRYPRTLSVPRYSLYERDGHQCCSAVEWFIVFRFLMF